MTGKASLWDHHQNPLLLQAMTDRARVVRLLFLVYTIILFPIHNDVKEESISDFF
jgi:hypothetical protein